MKVAAPLKMWQKFVWGQERQERGEKRRKGDKNALLSLCLTYSTIFLPVLFGDISCLIIVKFQKTKKI